MAEEQFTVKRISELPDATYAGTSYVPVDNGTTTGKLALKDIVPDGSTSEKGIVQLEDSHASTSTTTAATPKNVKEAYDLANGKYSKPSGGIPKSDLDSSVQQSLDNGDTALSTLQSIGKPLVWHGPADVATLNGTISGLEAGWTYTLTDSGTLTSGSVSVDVGDEVAWTGSAWFKVGGEGGTKVFKVSYSTSINDYVYPTYAEVNTAVQANKVPVILRYPQDSPVCQCFVFKSLSLGYINFENNDMYIRISSNDTVEYGYINDNNLAAGYETLLLSMR